VEAIARAFAGEIRVDDAREAVVVEDLTRTQIVQYAGASGDFNPIHHDEPFARGAGYPTVFAHGMLTMGLTAKLLTDWLGDGVLRSYGVRFVRQVWPGDTLTARGRVVALEDRDGGCLASLEVTTVNQQGEVVVAGTATAWLPRRGPPPRDAPR
jgi:acyl dehydratase